VSPVQTGTLARTHRHAEVFRTLAAISPDFSSASPEGRLVVVTAEAFGDHGGQRLLDHGGGPGEYHSRVNASRQPGRPGYQVVDGALGRRRQDPGGADSGAPAGAPPARWREHWHEHDRLLTLLRHDEHAAIYLDEDVNRNEARWLLRYISDLWQYSKTTYGDAFGPDPRLYSIHHGHRYPGGHPGYHSDSSHDHHNVSDCGPGPWTDRRDGSFDLPSHEISHVVESVNNGVHGSPAFGIWGDSKWAEFFQYDAYVALGLRRHALRLYNTFSKGSDTFPRPGTHWFRDWFYPLWKDGGHAAVMVSFFRSLARYFPTDERGHYRRDLNWGEYVHFTSGAAGTDLRPMARRAFGWTAEWSAQFEQARSEFPAVDY
jgi:hypothetical protein